ncbi:MAG: hypothetical protein WD708_09825, partial [Kiritimatiellia bacterium]
MKSSSKAGPSGWALSELGYIHHCHPAPLPSSEQCGTKREEECTPRETSAHLSCEGQTFPPLFQFQPTRIDSFLSGAELVFSRSNGTFSFGYLFLRLPKTPP